MKAMVTHELQTQTEKGGGGVMESASLLLIGTLGGSLLTMIVKDWLASRTGKKQLSHRVQFEAEYQIYRELWKKLAVLARRAKQLRPISENVDPNESEDDRRSRKSKAFTDAHNEAVLAIYDNRPFYAGAVLEACEELQVVTVREWSGYTLHRPGDEPLDGWEKAIEAAQKIERQGDVICEAIRKRIKEMEVRA